MSKIIRTELSIAIGERVRQLRVAVRETQVSFAEKAGFSNTTVSEIEAGNRLAGIDFLLAISQAYHASLSWLVHGIGNMFEHRGELEEIHARPDPETRIEEALRGLEERLRRLEQQDQQPPKPRVRKGFQ